MLGFNVFSCPHLKQAHLRALASVGPAATCRIPNRCLKKRARPQERALVVSLGDVPEPVPYSSPRANVSRRQAIVQGILALSVAAAESAPAQSATAEPWAEYRGPASLGFSFRYPGDTWTVKKKPIKTHMAEILVAPKNQNGVALSAGLTVDPVKISKIQDFGTPQDVGGKVVALEKTKDNVLGASLVATDSLTVDSIVYYVITYDVDTGRGPKRFVAKAVVAGGNLYVFTAQAKVTEFTAENAAVLDSMVESFAVKELYL